MIIIFLNILHVPFASHRLINQSVCCVIIYEELIHGIEPEVPAQAQCNDTHVYDCA